ncbi:nucleoredoxin-like [Sycon ciliatum]|uniref:nucleoredoxin-like n=1 Tax=Sycon ciliatum TaxID=27933 RepID=UPI0020A8ECC8|eukprot:scpid71542/ scgid27318/ Nucleoredoxin
MAVASGVRMGLPTIFGKILQRNASTQPDIETESLENGGKVVFLYFTAFWCPPCHEHARTLIKWYEKFKASENGDLLDIVFISLDYSEEEFTCFYNWMPWYALPYCKRETAAKLIRRYRIANIPEVVIVDSLSGRLITTAGLQVLHDDELGEKFPWTPVAVNDILQTGTFSRGDGSAASAFSELSGKVVGLLYTGSWCKPCVELTSILKGVYEAANKSCKRLEIIYISDDQSEESFEESLKETPFLGVGPSDARKSRLYQYFNITDIPRLVMLDEDWTVINEDARVCLTCDPGAEDFPWKYEPLNILHEKFARYLNRENCLIYMTDGSSEQMDQAKLNLEQLAVAERDKAEAFNEPQLIHFFISSSIGKADDVLKTLALPSNRPAVVILDDRTPVWYFSRKRIDAQAIESCVADYKTQMLEERFAPTEKESSL